jgi:hypothetical protein
MPQSDYNTTVTVRRPRYSSTPSPTKPAGPPTTIQTGVAVTKHLYQRSSIAQVEAAARTASPGRVVVESGFLKFTQPAPAIRHGDEAVEEGTGTVHHIKTVRTYARTLQADYEVFA